MLPEAGSKTRGEQVNLRIFAAAAAFMMFFAACGDDEANPQGSGSNPTPSTLTATAVNNTASLSWTQCPDDDFAAYNIYRGSSAGIPSNPSAATLVATVTDASVITHTDTGLDWNTPYYYAIQTVDSSQLTSWSNEVMITTPESGGGGGGVLSCYEVQGQQDESPYDGQDVSVTGIVTVAANEYYAGSSGTAQYAVIQDKGGSEWSGLVLYGYDGVMNSLARGDSVVVSGYVDEYYGLTELVVQSVDFRDPGHEVPQATLVTTGSASQEKWEGVLVKVEDVTVTDPDLGYGEWNVDDGSGNCRVDDLGLPYGFSVSQGDTYSSITGVLFYSYSNYKIEPRNTDDLVN
jgi:predicted extracellular nuclease